MANGNGKAVATRTEQLRTVSDYLQRATAHMNDALPRHLTPERLARVAITAIQSNPRLLECSKESLALALLEAGQLGLEPNGVLGQAYLVPYKNKRTNTYEAQFQPGYRGLIDLARRSGEIGKIEARVVRDGDRFEFEYGLHPKLVHRPELSAEGALTHVYAIAWFTNGSEPQFEVMDRQQVEAIRRRSRASGDGPWVTDYEAMARKTVVKRLAKFLPLSPEAEAVIEADNRRDVGQIVKITGTGIEVEDDEPDALTRTESVRGKLAERAGRDVGPQPEPETSEAQLAAKHKAYMARVRETGMDDDARHAWQAEHVGKASTSEWDGGDYTRAMEMIEAGIGLAESGDLASLT